MIPVKIKRIQQPNLGVGIDWSHWAVADLRFAIILQDGKAWDAITRRYVSSTGEVNGRRLSDAVGSDFDSTDYFEFTHDSRYALTGELTLFFRGIVDTGSATRHFCGKHLTNGATVNVFDFRTNADATPLMTLVRANTLSRNWAGPAVTLGAYANYAVSQSSAIESTPTFYKNGVPTTGTNIGGTGTGAPTSDTSTLRVGRRADGVTQLDGAASLVMGFNKVLSAKQHAELSLHPWQIFQPAKRKIWAYSVAGGAFKPAWAMRKARIIGTGVI